MQLRIILLLSYFLLQNFAQAQTTFSAQYDILYSNSSFDIPIKIEEKLKGYLYKKNNSILSYAKKISKATTTVTLPGQIKDNTIIQNITFNDSISEANFINIDSFYYRAHAPVQRTPFCMYFQLDYYKWEITTDTAIILNQVCQKAFVRTANSKEIYVTAWINPQIALSGMDIMGLRDCPGLIMKLEAPKIHTTWIMTEYKINPPVTDAQMTLKELTGPCRPIRKLSPEQLKTNQKRMDVLNQTEL